MFERKQWSNDAKCEDDDKYFFVFPFFHLYTRKICSQNYVSFPKEIQN